MIIHNGLITLSNGHELLQTESEPNTEQRASEDSSPQERVDYKLPHWSKRKPNHFL